MPFIDGRVKIMLDFNRDGKIDYKDQFHEYLMYNSQDKERIPTRIKKTKKQYNDIGCLSYLLIIFICLIAFLYFLF